MLDALWDPVQELLALDDDISDVGVLPMALRTAIVYVVTVAIIRLGSKRFLSRATAFDVIVAIMLGSIVSRAINGSAPFVPTLLGAGVTLVAMHAAFAWLSHRTQWFGTWVKGEPVLIVKDGELVDEGMRRSQLSSKDLAEKLRLNGEEPDVSHVKEGYLERSGDISLVPYDSSPRVVDISVEAGVQTVRIELQ